MPSLHHVEELPRQVAGLIQAVHLHAGAHRVVVVWHGMEGGIGAKGLKVEVLHTCRVRAMEALVHGALAHSGLVEDPAVPQQGLDDAHRSAPALLEIPRRRNEGLWRSQQHGGWMATIGTSSILEGHCAGALPHHITPAALRASALLVRAARVARELAKAELLVAVALVLVKATSIRGAQHGLLRACAQRLRCVLVAFCFSAV
mmetsp:Transcript_87424/g.209157  ORF Transcript_87424/g.209157 Transcript_87424/m.209157 type:complete len:203 (+) Transcript_87424:61-669(+)